MYYVYMIRCLDSTIYTGITTDLSRRIKEHITMSRKCAKYTRSHIAIKVEKAWKTDTKSLASKLEYYIKKLSRCDKEKLILGDISGIGFLCKNIEVEKYTLMEKIII